MARFDRANKFGLLCGVSLLSLAALTLPSTVLAQEAGGEEVVDEVVVTGIRASLASAQAIKQNADQIVDSITAVDIGRLPDVNIAEALQRVSGIQITRNFGEGSGIAIRGLTQVRSELNGRDIFSASGGRGLSWEEVSADLLAGVDVYKNPSAELIEGGLGGTINLRTRMPFDAKGHVISGTASYTHYDLANDDGKAASFLVSNRYDTDFGEFGMLLNVSYGDSVFRRDQAVMEPYWQRAGDLGSDGQPILPGETSVFVPNGAGIAVNYGDRTRVSTAVAFQLRPSDNLELYAQYLRADYTFNEAGYSFFAYNTGTELPLGPSGSFTADDNGVSQTGSFFSPGIDVVTRSTFRDTDTSDYSIGGKWQASPRLLVSADLQYVDSHVYQAVMNLTSSVRNARTGPLNRDWGAPPFPLVTPSVFTENFVFSYDTTGELPKFSATNGYLSNLNNYGLTAILPYREDNDAEQVAARVDLVWNFDEGGFLRDLRGGIRSTERTAINRSTTYGTWSGIGDCSEWGSPATCFKPANFPQHVEMNPFGGSFMYGQAPDILPPFYVFGSELVKDPQATFDFLGADPINKPVSFRAFDDPDAQTSNVTEKTQSAYAILRFGSEFMGRRWDGNAGVRVVSTEASSDGFQTINYRDPAFTPGVDPITGNPLQPARLRVVTAIEGGNDYTHVLPSLNLRMFLTDRLQLRAAASKNVSRPQFYQLNSQISVSPTYASDVSNVPVPGSTGTGNAQGNPELNPEQVTQFDVSLEWYFSSVGYVYATAFKKKIEDLIIQEFDVETFDVPGSGPLEFNVQRYVNVNEGDLQGFEVGGQRTFDFLPSPFDGLGIQANYTYIDSNAAVIAANATTGGEAISVPIQGLSKRSYNLVLFYQKYGFNVRAAYNWRDDYLSTTSGVGTGQLPIFGEAYGVLDASVSYDFNPRVAVTFDAQNILKQEFKTYQITPDRLRDYQMDDRRFTARIRVRY